jgi:hypothetical protein
MQVNGDQLRAIYRLWKESNEDIVDIGVADLLAMDSAITANIGPNNYRIEIDGNILSQEWAKVDLEDEES